MDQPEDEAHTSEQRELTIVIGDDQAANRLGVRTAIEPHGITVVAEATDSAAALRAVIQHQPDVCLLATWLPGKPLEAARVIRQTIPETKIVLLATNGHSDELFGALRAGVDGYLLMTTSPERLPDAIRGVVNGEAAIPRRFTAQLIEAFRQRQDGRRLTFGPERRSVALTGREFDVVDGLRKHVATAEIARGLSISEVTVRRHISSLMHKLEVPDRAALVKLLQREDPEVPSP